MMKHEGRTKKSLFNAMASGINNIINLLVKFGSRYVFIICLGREYLGVSALFSSVITLLSLADLGFSIALPQSLYEPLAKNNQYQIKRIIKFYGKVYTVIFYAVLAIGLGLLPFVKTIVGIENYDRIPNLSLIFCLFVIQSAVSYLFVYKGTLLNADQNGHIVSTCECVANLATALLQIIVLLCTKNYIVYLCVAIITTIIKNSIISLICSKKYEYIKKLSDVDDLNRNEKSDLSKKIYSLFIYKAASAVETGTDSIIMTAICGLTITGLCSNYTLITTSITQIVMVVMAAFTPSIGNLLITQSRTYSYKIYQELDFMGFWIYGVFGICILALIEPFINLWIGSDYLIDRYTLVVMVFNFYLCGVQNVNSNFRNAFGLFYEGRYRPVLMILVNIGTSIVLANKIGLPGIFLGTLLSRVLTVGVFDPYIVHKYGFHLPLIEYYKAHLKYHVIIICFGMLIMLNNMPIVIDTIWKWIIYGMVVFFSSNVLLILIFRKTEVFERIVSRIKGVFGV